MSTDRAGTDGSTPPLVSVTISNYNYARFLPRNLDSILGQTFTDFEVIVVDNASTDGSVEVLQAYAERDPRIRLVAHSVNQGALASIREGCDLARGRYRVHVDADDWVLEPTAFEQQVEVLEANPSVAFVYSSLSMYGPDEQRIQAARPHPESCVLPGEQALEGILSFTLNHSGMMIRLDAYRSTRGYPDGFAHVDDMLLAVRLAEVGDVAYVDQELYAFRQHGSNVHLAPELHVVSEEFLPVIDEAFAGPLGSRLADAASVRRRVERRALVHLPTQHIFSGRIGAGWRLYWESVKCRPLDTILQPRTVSLVARSILGATGYAALARRLARPESSGPMPTSTSRGPRFAILSPCGWGNVGDAAIIDSVVHAIRARRPGATILAFTLNPADTATRHDVDEAHPISSFSVPFYPVAGEPSDVYAGEPGPSDPGPPTRSTRVRVWLRRLPRAAGIRGVLLALIRLPREPRAQRELRRTLGSVEAVIVAGGGQLDATFGGFFGQPYVLWRWQRLARSVGARFIVLSVGTGTLSRPSRWLTNRALRGADTRSYRDDVSRSLLRAPALTQHDPVVPDLAYALARPAPARRVGPGVVAGVSPVNYRHPDFYPNGSLSTYQRYLEGMRALVVELLDQGCDVELFLTDGSDEVAMRDLVSLLAALDPARRRRVSCAVTDTVDALWRLYADVDVVFACRLHAALLAHVAHRPVIALAHERKVSELMGDMGQDRFCADILAPDMSELRGVIRALIDDRARLADDIAVKVAERRARVEHQYDVVLAPPPDVTM